MKVQIIETSCYRGDEISKRARLLKNAVKEYTRRITNAEDTKGNRTCQG